jgi:hypothetical protein
MIEFKSNDPFINKNRLTTFNVTYPRTVRFYTGTYDKQHIIHNLKCKIKGNISKKMSNMTYVRGKMTEWHTFDNDPDFATFFTDIMKHIKPIFAPDSPFDKELKCDEVWGNYLKKGDFVADHSHDTYHGILYLTEGTPLIFREMDMAFTPKPGDWIISPPHILHRTDPVEDDSERLNVVFNFKIDSNFREINEQLGTEESWKEKTKD